MDDRHPLTRSGLQIRGSLSGPASVAGLGTHRNCRKSQTGKANLYLCHHDETARQPVSIIFQKPPHDLNLVSRSLIVETQKDDTCVRLLPSIPLFSKVFHS